MNLLPEIFKQATARIVSRRDATQPTPARPRPVLVQAPDDFGVFLPGLNRQRKGVWTLKSMRKPNKGTQEYEATIENKKGRTQTFQWFWDGQKWGWRKKS